jgi:hypothetical protein
MSIEAILSRSIGSAAAVATNQPGQATGVTGNRTTASAAGGDQVVVSDQARALASGAGNPALTKAQPELQLSPERLRAMISRDG